MGMYAQQWLSGYSCTYFIYTFAVCLAAQGLGRYCCLLTGHRQ